eukprot:TRINITY_DN8201_c1_g1_i1.p3 TRINITY_DN8201_c1_g1~~TRINITY_DN8201_c1_g1_i1.p3  ORF type:complete len:103 (-),score=5.42 TRINITY_DN8201_c1_g1_i1:906-1214(-)
MSTLSPLRTFGRLLFVESMWRVGKDLLIRDAPDKDHRFGFHRPPFNSVGHLHLHCLALPYKHWVLGLKYISVGRLTNYISAADMLKRLEPEGGLPPSSNDSV